MDSAKQELSEKMLLLFQFVLPLSVLFHFLPLSRCCVFFPSVDSKALVLLCTVILLFVTKQSAAAAKCFGKPGTEEEDAGEAEDGDEEESTRFAMGDEKVVEEDELGEKIEAFIEKVKRQRTIEALQIQSPTAWNRISVQVLK